MSPPRKIPLSALPDIRARRDGGEPLRSIAKSYGVSHVAVHHALTRPVSPKAARLAALERVADAARPVSSELTDPLPIGRQMQWREALALRDALAELDRTKP